MAATDSRWGAYHGKMPPNGEHEGVREDGETEWVVKAPAESQDGAGSGAEYKPNGERRGRGGPMHAFGHAHTLLLMSSRGNAYYVLMFGIGNGTGNTTPVPDGAIGVAWTGGHGQVPSSPVLGGCPTFEQLLGRSANAPVGGSNPRQDGVINPDRNGDGAGTGVKGSGGVSGLLKPQPAPPPPSVKVGDKAAPAPKGNAPSGKDRKDSRR